MRCCRDVSAIPESHLALLGMFFHVSHLLFSSSGSLSVSAESCLPANHERQGCVVRKVEECHLIARAVEILEFFVETEPDASDLVVVKSR